MKTDAVKVMVMGVALAAMGAVSALRAEEGLLRGQVFLPQGGPAVGAKVHCAIGWWGNKPLESRAVTDAEGKFTLDDKAPNIQEGWLTIDAADCALSVIQLSGPKWRGALEKLELKPGYTVSGQVLDENKKGVVGSRLSVVNLQPHSYKPGFINGTDQVLWPELNTISGEEGRFTLRGIDFVRLRWLDLPDRMPSTDLWVALAAVGPGDKARLLGQEEFFPMHSKVGDPEVTNPVIVLTPTIPVNGRVVNADTGSALEGATVSFFSHSVFGMKPVITGADGRFSFVEVPSYSSPEILVTHPDLGPVHVFRADSKTEGLQPAVENLEVHLRGLHTVSGKIVDAESGGKTLVPIELTVQQNETLSAGFVQQMQYASSRAAKLESNGKFSVQAPTGSVAFHVEGSTVSCYNHEFVIEVPKEGKSGLQLKLPRTPGVLVQLEASDPKKLLHHGYGGDLIINVREEGINGEGYADSTPRWFYPVSAWGKKMEVQMVRRIVRKSGSSHDVEILPWTAIVADPKTWPVRLKVP